MVYIMEGNLSILYIFLYTIFYIAIFLLNFEYIYICQEICLKSFIDNMYLQLIFLLKITYKV